MKTYDWQRLWRDVDGHPWHPDADGFLPEPNTPIGRLNHQLQSFAELAAVPCVVLLGAAGMGKTYAMRQALETARKDGDCEVQFIDLRKYTSDRAKGMARVAREAGLSRESLYKALSGERSPDFETILKVVGALGLELHATAREGHAAAGQAARRALAGAPVKAAAGARRRAGSQPGESAAVEPSKPRRQRASAR